MRVAQSRQKSYTDWRRRPLEFEVGDQVFLRVSPTKGIIRFDMMVTLAQGILSLILLRNELKRWPIG